MSEGVLLHRVGIGDEASSLSLALGARGFDLHREVLGPSVRLLLDALGFASQLGDRRRSPGLRCLRVLTHFRQDRFTFIGGGSANLAKLLNFRQRLALAIEARDAEGVGALAAPDVKLDFGGGAGRAELARQLDDSDSPLWGKLDELMTLGCAANGQAAVTIPWFFAQDMEVDPFLGMIATGEDVPLRESPDAVAVPVAQLDWDAVELVDSYDAGAPYQRVEFGDATGYVETRFLRSIVDYRIIASSRNGKWRITSFVAGD